MRPLKLSVRGFMSFRQEQLLDLSDLGLFAIVGSTGSGKSALLDAMTFALYGRTPRLGASGLEALISLGESSCGVTLEFAVRGERFLVARSRGTRQKDNQVTLEKWDEAASRWIRLSSDRSKDTDGRVAEAVGLSYEAFTRAVLLPQGEFAALLRATPANRQKLLGELTNLGEVVEMAAHARTRAQLLQAQLDSKQGVLELEYAGVSADAVQACRAALEDADSRGERLGQLLGDLQLRHQRLLELAEGARAFGLAQAALDTHRGRDAGVAAGLRRARAAQRVAGVQPLMAASAAAVQVSAQAASALRQREERLHAARRAEEGAALRRSAAREALAQEPGWLERLRLLERAGELQKLLKWAGGRPEAQHARPLPWDQLAFSDAQAQAVRAREAGLERVQLDARRAAFDRQGERLAGLGAVQAQEGRDLEGVKAEGTRARRDLDRQRAALREAEVQAGLAAFHDRLHLGEPCPLCGGEVHALPTAPRSDLAELRSGVQELEAARESLLERHNRLSLSVRGREADILKEDAAHAEEGQHLQDRGRALRELEAQLSEGVRTGGDPLDTVARFHAGLAGELRLAGRDPQGEARRLQGQLEAARAALQVAEQEVQAGHTAAQVAAAEHHAAQELAGVRAGEAGRAEAALVAALAELGLSAGEAQAAQLPHAEVAQLERAAQDHEAQGAVLTADFVKLERLLGGRRHDPAALTGAVRELDATGAEHHAALSAVGQLREQLSVLRRKLETRSELEAQVRGLSEQQGTWKALGTALNVSHFQKFLMSELESALLSGAGVLFHGVTDGRYRLELKDGEYMARDFWNGGELRAVRTLSGGETFLASLSLAIALSDYLTGNQVLGALFLDEGFGTLDPQALEAVAGALSVLNSGGRMVGVITHIEAFSEQLPMQLLVSKSLAGSTVTRL